MTDTFHHDWLTDLEVEVAALLRQFSRAAEQKDRTALDVETQGIGDRIHSLLYHHLGLHVGEASDGWFWVSGVKECQVEQRGALEVRAMGRMWCSLPDRRPQWTEPFTARFTHSATAQALTAYTLQFGSRSTMLDLPETQSLIDASKPPDAPPPAEESGWAFVFRMGDRG
jgi:hypothetical protein